MFDITGKNALITGASGGIGGAIATALHSAGATVALSGTRTGPLEDLAAQLGERAHVLPCNLSDMAAVDALPEQAAEAMGSVDILVNNAGITRDNLFMRMSDEEWQSVLDVNLTATFKLCKGVLRGMMKARWGRIINISSVVGATGNPGQANYAASKAGTNIHIAPGTWLGMAHCPGRCRTGARPEPSGRRRSSNRKTRISLWAPAPPPGRRPGQDGRTRLPADQP